VFVHRTTTDLVEICDLLGYYAVLSGSSVPTFQDNLFKGEEVQEDILGLLHGILGLLHSLMRD
jgi:hypothetical protein